MNKPRKDVGASVRARLLQLAKLRGDDFQLLLTRYANERLLYRLTKSQHAGLFVLKGAALFTLWTGHAHRATRDVDLLGFGEPSVERLRAIFAEVVALDVDDDGVVFDHSSLKVEPIREDQLYGGIRLVMIARITNAQVRLQVDVGFGDAVTPEAQMVEFPPLLDFPAPQLRAYPERDGRCREARRHRSARPRQHAHEGLLRPRRAVEPVRVRGAAARRRDLGHVQAKGHDAAREYAYGVQG
jgi:hypothetical protein